jgi:hypothetical protein
VCFRQLQKSGSGVREHIPEQQILYLTDGMISDLPEHGYASRVPDRAR